MIQKTFPSAPSNTSPEAPILEHGLDLIFSDGIKGFTVETLAKDLSMSKKTIYKFFPSKEILLQKIFRHVMTIIARNFKKVHEQKINPLDKFEIAIGEIIKTLNRVSITKIRELKARYPQIWVEIEAFRLARREDFMTIFSEAQSQGYIRDEVELELTSIIFMNIINDVFQPEFFIKNEVGLRETILTFTDIFLRGIITEKGLKHIEDRI